MFIKSPEFKAKKILIAGAYGMVGQAINRALLQEKLNSNTDNLTILTPSRKDLDLSNFIEVERWFKKYKPEIVILAAAKVGGILANKNYPSEFILNNLKIQTNLIEISHLFGVRKFLFLGSSCIYPKFSEQPIIEEALLTKSLEETNQFYAIAKIAGLKLCEALSIQDDFNAISLMPTNLYGPGDNYHESNSHVLPALIRKFKEAKENNEKKITCWGTGNPLREFLYVDDLADACIFALKNWNPKNKEAPKDQKGYPLHWLNVGSDSEISVKHLAEKISDIVGFEGEIFWDKDKPDGTPRKKLDSSRISKLGWKSRTKLDEGIRKTIKAYDYEITNKKVRK